MAEQTHSGSGDIVGGNQTKIDRQIELGNHSHYVEKQILYGERKIPRILTLPPFIPEIFEGRDDDLQAVHEKLFGGNTLLLLVNGEGGIGKTSLAAKYWQCYEDDYKHTAWIFAQKNLLDALLTLALPLQVSFPEAMPGEQRLGLLLKAMTNLDKPCLLILDNVNHIEELEKHYLSLRSCPNFHVLLTSRITHFEQAQTFQIKPLQDEDALRVFKMHYPRHRQDQDGLLKSIRTAVGGNTLVMELLAKNLAALNSDEIAYSLADLLQDLQTKGLLQLSQTEPVMTQEKGSHPALKKAKPTDIIGALYDEMEMVVPLTEAEQQLLSNLAVLPAENLAYPVLKTLLTPEDTKAFSKLLTGLAKRGWLEKSVQGDDSFYKISPVVQEITRHKNKDNLLSNCATLIGNLIVKLAFQPGIGHFLNATYQEAALYCRYAEAIMNCLQVTNANLSRLYDCIGNYHNTTGNLSQAFKFFMEYYRLNNELYEADPNNANLKNNLAIACQNLGITTTALGNLDQALHWYEDYHRLARELHEAYTNNANFKNNLTIACQKLGNTATALGKLDQALGWYEQSHHLAQELYEAYPTNVDFKNVLAIACQFLGTTDEALGNLDQALDWYKQLHRLEQELYEAYPTNVRFKHGLAVACQKLGNTDEALGNLDQAWGWYAQSHHLAQELYEAYPTNVNFKNGLAIACQFLGITTAAQDKLDQALGWYEQSYRLKQELYVAYPSNVSFKNGLAIACQKLGSMAAALGNLDQALGWYEQLHHLEQELYEAYPTNVDFKNSLAIACQWLGITDEALGNLDQALGWYEQYHHLEQELYEAYPTNVDFKNGLALSYQFLGWVYEKINNETKAQECYGLSRKLLEQLVTNYPLNIKFKNNLEWVKNRLGDKVTIYLEWG